MQMNDGDGSRSSEQESEGRADSGQSAVSFASCTLHVLLHVDRVCATDLQLIKCETHDTAWQNHAASPIRRMLLPGGGG